MRTVRRVVGIVVAAIVVMLAVLPVTEASAQRVQPPVIVQPPIVVQPPPSTTQPPSPTFAIGVKPTTGPAGTPFYVSWKFSNTTCKIITFSWKPGPIPSSPSSPPAAGSVQAPVPIGTPPGTYEIYGACGRLTDTTRYTVTAPPPTSNPPTTTTTTKPPTIPVTTTTTTKPPTPGVTTTTTPKPTITVTNGTTITLPPEVTTTDANTPSTTDTPPATTTEPLPPITDEPKHESDLKFDRESIQPGDELHATGKGCEANHDVQLISGGETVATTTANEQGEFATPVHFTKIVPGRHVIVAKCGIVLTGSVDHLVTSSTGGSSTTLVVLVFFVLAGGALIRLT